MQTLSDQRFRFGGYELDLGRRILTRGSEIVVLNAKSFDLLCTLIANRGRVMSKDELLDAVWPDQFVEENNLTVQISALRKAFGERKGENSFIATIPGKGYTFVADVEEENDLGSEIVEQRVYERITVTEDVGPEHLQLPPGSKRPTGLMVAAAVALLLVLTGASWWYFRSRPTAQPKVDAIAVMPFTYQGERSDAEFLTDGVTESLINNLSQMQNLTVKARSSVFRYKGRDVDARTIGAELGVQAVMLGKIVENGDQLSLSLELVNAVTGDQIWGERYSRKRTDIATLSNEIARDVVGKLRLKLSGDPFARGQTKDSEAYELYLRGRFLWNKRKQKDHEVALELFEKAIARDPNFALAYAAVADVCAVDSYKPPESVDCGEKGRKYIAKALEIEPQLSDPYAALASLETFKREWSKADEHYRKAIELNPNNGMAHHWRAELLIRLGRKDEAIAEMKTALLIDPVSQVFNNDYAYILLYSRRYEEGLAQARRAHEMNADWGTDEIVYAYEYLERYSDALDASLDHPFVGGESPENIVLANQKVERVRARFQKEGPLGYWKGWLEETLKDNEIYPGKQHGFTAVCYLKIGEYEKALDTIEQAINQNQSGVELAFVDPHCDPIREMPRYKELMRRLGMDVK